MQMTMAAKVAYFFILTSQTFQDINLALKWLAYQIINV